MSGWDIDDEESPEQAGYAGRIGAQFYTLVVHYRGAVFRHLVPHHAKRGPDGAVIKSTYNKMLNQTEEGDKETVKVDKVEKWATKKDILDTMKSDSKAACNAVKQFLGKSQVIGWYHNAYQDHCSLFAGQIHWHFILMSDIGANGHYRYIHDIQPYRTMKAKVQAAGGYCKVERVRMIDALIKHFNTAPRVYIGTNTKALYQLWKESANTIASDKDYAELVEADEADDTGDPRVEKRFSSWDDDEPSAKKSTWDTEEEPFVLPAASKMPVMIKETPTDSFVRLLRTLMQRYGANNMSEMFMAISRLPKGVDEQYKSAWFRLSSKPNLTKHMETALNYLKCDALTKSFGEMIHTFCTAPDTLDRDDYHSPDVSYKLFMKWMKKQHIDAAECITNIINVMNKAMPKVNSVAFIGPSNSGKTVMITNPLRMLTRYNGMIGNRGTDSAFIWQECVNCRAIYMDECIMGPEHYEELKLLFGGEPMKVAVKFQNMATIQRTPVFLTGNKDPWVLDYSSKEAFLNRMYHYTVEMDDDLKDVKQLHPGMWHYAQQQYEQLDRLLPFSKLTPYPTPEQAEVVIADPLD